MISLNFERLWLSTVFFSIFSVRKCVTLTICSTAKWQINATTVAGSSSGAYGYNSTILNLPFDLEVANDSTIYVSDTGNYRIQCFPPNSTVATTVISASVGAIINQNSTLDGISLGLNGSIYILDNANNRVSKWASNFTNGIIVAGGNGQGNNSNQLYLPHGMFVDFSTSFIWIADTGNSRIVRWESPSTGVIVCGGYGASANQFAYPFGLFVDTSSSNTFYVADTYNHRIQMWLSGATVGTTAAGQTGVSGIGLNQFAYPTAVLVDTNGYMYIVDYSNCRIMRWMIGSAAGVIIAGNSICGTSPYQLKYSYNIRFNSNGDLFIADTYNNRIQKFSVSCDVSASSGSSTLSTSIQSSNTSIISTASTMSVTTIMAYINSSSSISSSQTISSSAITLTTKYANSSSAASVMLTTTTKVFGFIGYHPKWSLMIICLIMILTNN